jgi:hypothetical protein
VESSEEGRMRVQEHGRAARPACGLRAGQWLAACGGARGARPRHARSLHVAAAPASVGVGVGVVAGTAAAAGWGQHMGLEGSAAWQACACMAAPHASGKAWGRMLGAACEGRMRAASAPVDDLDDDGARLVVARARALLHGAVAVVEVNVAAGDFEAAAARALEAVEGVGPGGVELGDVGAVVTGALRRGGGERGRA